MLITRGYRTKLDLNNKQVTLCKQHAGCVRFAYNWGFARKQAVYQTTGRSISAMELHRELNALKPTDFPWMYECSKAAPQEALRDLDKAYQNFFRRCQLKKEGKWKGPLGFPTYKTKRQGLGSFRLTGSIHIYEKAIDLPRLGQLRLKECGYLPVCGVKVLSATVSGECLLCHKPKRCCTLIIFARSDGTAGAAPNRFSLRRSCPPAASLVMILEADQPCAIR